MNIREAQAAIGAILDAIPDDELPKPDKVEHDDEYGPTIWWGSHGYHIASTRTGYDEPNPIAYRRDATWKPIEMEMVYRASKEYFDKGGELRTHAARRSA